MKPMTVDQAIVHADLVDIPGYGDTGEALEVLAKEVERLRAEAAKLRETYAAAHEAHLKIGAQNTVMREQSTAYERVCEALGYTEGPHYADAETICNALARDAAEMKRLRAEVATSAAHLAAVEAQLEAAKEACDTKQLAECDGYVSEYIKHVREELRGAAIVLDTLHEEHEELVELRERVSQLEAEANAARGQVEVFEKENARMLKALEHFEREIERRGEQLARGAAKGMSVPYTGDFVSAPPSVVGRLRWHLRNIRGK